MQVLLSGKLALYDTPKLDFGLLMDRSEPGVEIHRLGHCFASREAVRYYSTLLTK